MSSVGSATSTAALQAADKTTDKALLDATRKLAVDQRAKAGEAAIRADQKAISTATKAATDIDKQLAQASASTQTAAKPASGVRLTV